MKTFEQFILEQKLTRQEALDILGLASSFTEDDLKKAFRKKSIESHPDRGGSTELMQKVNNARDTLASSAGSSSGDSMANWREREKQYEEASKEIEKDIIKHFKIENFIKYFSTLTGENFSSNITSKANSSAAYLLYDFFNSDKSISFTMSVYVRAIDRVHSNGGITSSENIYYPMHISTEFFANNRKQTITKRDYNTKNDLNVLSDPTIVFPKAKIEKGLKNTSTKFAKKDMNLFLTKKLGGKPIKDGWFIPFGDGNILEISRFTFMKSAFYDIVNAGKATKYSYTRSLSRPVFSTTYVPESEDAANAIEMIVKEMSKTEDVGQWANIIKKHVEKFKVQK